MKISRTDLAMQADHQLYSQRQSSERLRVWRGERPDFESRSIPQQLSAIPLISTAAREAAAVPLAPTFSNTGEAPAIEAANETVENDPIILLIKQMIEFLTGEEVRVFDMQSFFARMHHAESHCTSEQLQSATTGRGGFGIEYDYYAIHEENETMAFSAAGTIRTADGQEISFRFELAMERHYREETHISLSAGNARRKDPLVVNFGGTADQLLGGVGQHFRFDLDSDGLAEELPLLASGSGYLALDINGNGRIDSGKELFGPQSGNGFVDLGMVKSTGLYLTEDGKAGSLQEIDLTI